MIKYTVILIYFYIKLNYQKYICLNSQLSRPKQASYEVQTPASQDNAHPAMRQPKTELDSIYT